MFKTPGGRYIAVAINKAHAGLPNEIFLELVDHPEVFQQTIAKRQKRFTDVLTRKFFPFE